VYSFFTGGADLILGPHHSVVLNDDLAARFRFQEPEGFELAGVIGPRTLLFVSPDAMIRILDVTGDVILSLENAGYLFHTTDSLGYFDPGTRESVVVSIPSGQRLSRLGERIYAALRVEDGHVCAVGHRGKSSIARLEDGNPSPRWIHEIPTGYNWLERGLHRGDDPQPRIARVARMIGEHGGIVWMVLDSGRLLGVDAQSGATIHDLVYPANLPTDWEVDRDNPVNIYNINTLLDAEGGKLFGIFLHYYWEVDLASGPPQLVYHDILPSCQSFGLDLVDYGAHDGELIYFHHSTDTVRFGAFDRRRMEVLWTQEIEGASARLPAVRKMTFANRRLFVLDHSWALHVYQR
jgi:hypothetical protein